MASLDRSFRALSAFGLAAMLALAIACSSAESKGATAVEQAPAATEQAARPQDAPAPAAAPAPSNGQAAPAAPAPAQAGAEPDADLAYQHIRKLAVDIGERSSGTPSERAAAEYIAATLRSYGYDVQMQRFPVSSFVSRKVALQVDAPQKQALTAQAMTNSRAGQASGELVFAGIGRESEFPAAVRGKIALIERGELTFQQKAANAAAAGAVAAVIFNSADDLALGDLGERSAPIPVLSIAGVDGRALRDRLRAGPVRVSLEFDGGTESADSINVIARTPGARCRAILGGHYDSVPAVPAASDNASGTGAVIEMARVQAARGNPEHACFAAFGSEETGLDGSRAFVRSLSAEDKQALRFMLNFDMVAVGTEWLLIGTPALQQQGRAILGEMGLEGRATTLLGASSDHASFISAGIPALFLHRSNDPLLHTPGDVIDRISKDDLGESMRIGLALLAGINPA